MYPNLKLQLWRSGIRQNRLAQQLGMDETLLSRIVNGHREPNSEVRAQIAALLHTDEQWLFEPTTITCNDVQDSKIAEATQQYQRDFPK